MKGHKIMKSFLVRYVCPCENIQFLQFEFPREQACCCCASKHVVVPGTMLTSQTIAVESLDL